MNRARIAPLIVVSFGASFACTGGGTGSAAATAGGAGGAFHGTGGAVNHGGASGGSGASHAAGSTLDGGSHHGSGEANSGGTVSIARGGASSGGNAGSSASGGAADGGDELSRMRYGFTLDAVDDVTNIVDSLSKLPKRALVRVVFDYPEPPSTYRAAIDAIVPHADVVGQPSDSTYTKKMSVDDYRARFEDYVSSFPEIELWEACNECNGDWAGENTPAQTDAAFDVIKSHGKRVLFTPYWNEPDCADTHGDYLAWTEKNISDKVKTGADLVAVSIYGTDCAGPEPTYAELDSMFVRLASMFPDAQLGIGEYGAKAASDKERVLRYYLDYSNPAPRYVFWGGYWYGHQDFVPATKPLWKVFADAMR